MADWPALKNASILLVFPFYDGSGCRITAGAGLAACVSIDGAAMAITSCGSAMAELNSGAGLYKLTLLAAEMNGDVIGWKAVSTTASARDAMGVIYTATRQMKDLAFPNTTGRGLYVDTSGNVTVGSMLDNTIHRGAFAGSALAASVVDDATLTAAKIGTAALAIGKFGTTAIAASNIDTAALAIGKFGTTAIAASNIDAAALAIGKFGTNAIAASNIDTNAITSAQLAAGAVAIGKLGTNALAASNIDAGAISIGRLATNAIAASNIDTAAISVGKFGASAIAASVFSGCAITNQIFSLSGASQVWDAAVRALTAGVTVTTNNDKTGYVLGASSIAASTFAASSIDTNAFGLTAACTIWNPAVRAITSNQDKTGYVLGASSIAASSFALDAIDKNSFATNAGSKVWDAAVRTITGTVTVGANNDKTGYALAASSIAASTFAVNAVDTNAFAINAGSKIWDAAVRTITGTVTVGANNDKTGYVLAASAIAASSFALNAIDINSFATNAGSKIWDAAVRTITGTVTVATNNDKTGYVLGASSIGASTFALNAIDTNSFATNAGSKVWDAAVRTITGTVTVGANNDKTGYVLAASSIGASTFEVNAIDKNSFATNAGSKVWDAGVRTLTALGASSISVSVFADSAASRVAEVVLTGITLTEMPQGQPTATPTLASAIQALYMAWRNTASTSTGCIMVTNDAGTVVFKASISDSASIFQRSKWVSGP